MQIIADLHIHSKYARACSKDLNPANLSAWAMKKGIQILGTGDFTHPLWMAELEESLEESKPGLYKLRNSADTTLFMLSSEVALIYKQGDKVRRVHVLLYAPNIAAAKQLNQALTQWGANIKSDGRPIMGLHCADLVKLCKNVDQQIEIIPAHAWTPHFGVFGSLSGFDSLEEAFGDQAEHIFAIETGLSSDPKMNWQVPELQNIALISNSDAHSLRKLGREANVFDIPEQQLSYRAVIETIKKQSPAQFLYTIEFFPEEGKYHMDGHANCKFSCLPNETKRLDGRCPKCGKKILRGVLSRVDELAGQTVKTAGPIPYKSIIPLEEIIADVLNVGTASKKVLAQYERLVAVKPEFYLLLDATESELSKLAGSDLAEAILKVRRGEVDIQPGYDGIFGKISLFSEQERQAKRSKKTQAPLF